ncbi:uncharacterized protein [Venturia canescens]|uniref:uncharacterized protein n=1 Tax=Venturia canescens TaxID=32260 RepID=UPI001C9C8F6D|nr:uncharacterized protein LOC122415017 [Venturia canescens]XP_043282711.1 uncharacterized protein LOC122415017 [Venturia canescens]
MIVDIMGKVQNWTNLVQVRLDAAKTDLDNLRRELLSRSNEIVSKDAEIAGLKAKLNETELSKIAVEKVLAENIQKSSEMIQSSSSKTQSSHKRVSGVPSLAGSPEGDENAAGTSEAQRGVKSGAKPGAQMDRSDAQFGDQAGGIKTQSGVRVGSKSGAQIGEQSGQIRTQDGHSGTQLGASAYDQRPLDSAAATSGAIGQRLPDIQEKYPQDKSTSGPGQQSSGISGMRQIDYPSTTDVGVQSGKTKDIKRSSDLESEVVRLRKENERIIRERTDYENAIQRALLRGVSSLNAETLKVLKCPPVSCYSPCRPPPSPVNANETMMPCFPKSTRDNWTPRGVRTSTNGTQSTQGTVRTRSNVTSVPEQEIICCGGRTASNGTHRLGSKQKKSSITSDNSMVFLLHQAEASGICVSGSTSRNRAGTRTKLKRPENSICVKKLG